MLFFSGPSLQKIIDIDTQRRPEQRALARVCAEPPLDMIAPNEIKKCGRDRSPSLGFVYLKKMVQMMSAGHIKMNPKVITT